MMGIYLAWYAYQRWARHQDSTEAALQALAVGQPNFAAAAFPVITALFGASHLSTVAVGIAVGSLLPSPLTVALLELDRSHPAVEGPRGKRGGKNGSRGLTEIRTALRRALSKPIVLAPVSGMLVSLSGWPLPEFVTASLRQIGTAAGGRGLLVTGLVLSESKLQLTRNTALGVGISNIVQPLLTFLICRAVGASVEITKLAVIMAALPSGFFGILYSNTYEQLSSETNSTIIVSTLLSALTLAVAIGWTYNGGGGGAGGRAGPGR